MNRIILTCCIVIFPLVLSALHSQTPIGDIQYMKAMIPHHSSAILTSKHANLRDPEVKQLSVDIIRSQEKEIEQMKIILKRLRQN